MSYEIKKCPECGCRVGLTVDNWRCLCGYIFADFLRSLEDD